MYLRLPTTNQKDKTSPKFGSHRCHFETPELDNIMTQKTVKLRTSVALYTTNKQCLESLFFVSINVRYIFCRSVTDITHLTGLNSVLSRSGTYCSSCSKAVHTFTIINTQVQAGRTLYSTETLDFAASDGQMCIYVYIYIYIYIYYYYYYYY